MSEEENDDGTSVEENDEDIKDDDDYAMMMDVAKQITTTFRRRSTQALLVQETYKEKIAKSRECRTERSLLIQSVHKYICEMVGIYLGISSIEVIDGVLDSQNYVDELSEFICINGPMAIMFYYQEGPRYDIDNGRVETAAMKKQSTINRIYVSTGEEKMSRQAIAVYKVANINIDLKNVQEQLFFTEFDISLTKQNCVAMGHQFLEALLSSTMSLSKDWGDLVKTEAGLKKKIKFENDYSTFVRFLQKTKGDLESVITFDIDENILSKLLDGDTNNHRHNREFVMAVDGIVRGWNKKIERALVQYQQLRREDEFVGPLIEVEYWRNQLSRFTSMMEFITGPKCQAHINFLKLIYTPNLKTWKKQYKLIQNTRNECADNVKYLYSFESFCEPLYLCEPMEMSKHIPAILHTLRMIFNTSRYFNNMSNITALLVKISNQIVINCRYYLNCKNTKTVWNQPKKLVLEKVKHCLDAYLKYYQCFKHTQEEMSEAGEPEFGCSEMYVFGKLETFKKRLEEIMNVIKTTTAYSILESSNIEGIDEYAKKFKTFYTKISHQEYDALNHRLHDFSKDYEEFRQSVVDTEWELEEFVGTLLAKMQDVDNVLRMLQRFEKLNLSCLHLDERYLEAMMLFQEELGNMRDFYNEERQAPAVPRNMPPVSGRVMWVRLFYKKIVEPMTIFKEKTRVMKHIKVQKCIQMYNALSMVFIHYEQMYHQAWFKHAGQVSLCLNAPIMVRNPVTRRYHANYDPYIDETIRESEYMYRMQLNVPDIGRVLVFCKEKIMGSVILVKDLIARNNAIRKSIPSLFVPLMRTLLLKIETALMPAFSILNWTSLELPKFCEKVTAILDYVEFFVKEVTDLKEARIDSILNSIANTNLVYIDEKPMNPQDFFDANNKHRLQMAKEIEQKSLTTEKAVIDLITKFLDQIDQPELQEMKYYWLDPEKAVRPIGSTTRLLHAGQEAAFYEIDLQVPLDMATLHADCIELFAYFNLKVTESLVKCTKLSLDTLKDKTSLIIAEHDIPIMQTKMELHIPLIVINPAFEEIQKRFVAILNNIIDNNNFIALWGQKGTSQKESGAMKRKTVEASDTDSSLPKAQVKNYYKAVADNKEVIRMFMSLQGALTLVKPDVVKLLAEYLKYSYLWAEDREQQINDYCDQNPLPVETSERFQEYVDRSEALKELPKFVDIGAIRINLENFILALIVESNAWKHSLGKNLKLRNTQKLDEAVDFIKTQEKILSKPFKDLDECRLAMQCLERIRDNFVDMDMQLNTMEEMYSIFNKYKVDVPQDDIDRIDTLRFNFVNMNNHAKIVQETICDFQGPLLEELTEGVNKFQQEVIDFDHDFEEKGPMIVGISAREASDRVLVFQDRFDELWRKFDMYSSGEKLFGLEVKDYPILHQRKKEFQLLNKLYGLYLTVNQCIDGYYDIPWADLDLEAINSELAEFQNRCRKLPKALKDWPAFNDLKKKIDDFSETCPLLELMTNKAMKDRHWERLSTLCSYNFDIESPTITLRGIMDAPLLHFKDDVEDICISAVKEKDIDAKLKQIIADWALVELSFSLFKSKGELLLKGTETSEIIMALEDSLMILNSLLSNRYNTPFKKDIQLWVQKLVTTSEILEKWLLVQNLWVYLEAVFVGGDIAKQLPAEAKRFSNIDKSWVRIMTRAHEITNAIECCAGDETMGQLLPHLLEQLETCQKSLTGYLESKRLCFPRFFFISDPVLLEILGQSSDPTSIQPHLPSLFDAVYQVDFDAKEIDCITAMSSDLGERIPLEKSVKCSGGVEFWLNTLLETVKETVKLVIAGHAQCLIDPEYNFVVGFQSFCGQAGLVGLQILWTRDSEYALRRCRIDKLIMKTTNQKFLDLLNSLIELTSKDLPPMVRIRFETMVTIHVHQRDIFDDIYKLKVRTITDFEWQKQTRFYYNDESDDILLKITDVIFLYQNEYLGITERLVITPLTDRCYITLAQAIWINMGGAPAGPAGTGKTETVKDMGRTLGKFVVVFNCSDQMDFRGLGRIFKGLAQSGSWGCFDEFNRIELPVLSVAAQQIYIVLIARKERKTSFIFMDGDNVAMNFEFGIFLTMNPGYAGRQELPENLKIMFRSVAMMVPDRQIIIRVKLASCGFKENIILSRKFFTLYALCEEQLSKQVHYDFGLRNILSVLRTLGSQKRSNPTDTEETIVMRVLRDMNLSKLIDEDEPLFLSLIEDMFPGIKLTTYSWKELQKALTHVIADAGLINYPSWNLKVIQLYETSLVRHGLMVLGPTGAGKTQCMHMLMKAMTETGKLHKELRMNPKAITAPQMFGRLDVATNDWTDGIFSTLWRRTLKFKKSDYCWLVLDGPVDAVWIENLNSVLDDNKTLTLANGDRIVMSANCKLVFEPDNVDNASPATVSRMGMVFLSASVLPWSPILEALLKTRSSQEMTFFKNLFEKIYYDVQEYVLVRLKPKMMLRRAMYIRQCYDILQGILDVGDESKNYNEKQLERVFLFAIMWSVGALLELEDREKMEHFVISHHSKLDWPKVRENETIFEYLVNSENGKWQHWSERVEPFIYPTDSILDFTSILVPNVDNVRTAFLIETVAKQKKAVLLIGEQGTAKTVMHKGYTSSFNPEYALSKCFNFSSATTPNMVQRIIESYVDKRVGTTYGPPAGKTLTIFIDDINMPVINDWGDQVTNEIVRQLMETKGFYSLDKPGDFSSIVDVTFLAAMIHPGGGRNDIPHRLKRQFCIFNCTIPGNKSMDSIFQQIAGGYFCPARFTDEVVEVVDKVIQLTRLVWQNTKVKMLPTPAKFHYVFNLRDLSRIWQGILKVQGGECTTIRSFLNLWRHECLRVISDRFVDHADKVWFVQNMMREMNKELSQYKEYISSSETLWVDFLKEPPDITGDEPEDFVIVIPKVYEEVPSLEFLRQKLKGYQEQFNEVIRGTNMDIVFFHDAMVNLVTISRVIRTAKGNALLVGVGGSGKQSLTKLTSFIANYKFHQIQLTRSYNVNNLMEDIKYLYRVAGLEGKGISFIFTDNEIKEETFLESLNNILSSGEIANLFAKDELDEIQSDLIPIMKKVQPKRPASVDNLYDFFIQRSIANLHVVLCFSPIGEKFRNRALKFPGLISGCTINWFSRWPKDALVEVSSHFLMNFSIIAAPDVKLELINIMGEIQDGVAGVCDLYFDRFRRKTYVTPKTYISFLNSYKTLYKHKLDEISDQAHRMKTGLSKLVEAQVSVDALQKELVVKEVEVTKASTAADEVLEIVLSASEVANKVKEEATTVKDRAETIVEVITNDKQEATVKLMAAKPALDAAAAALLTIKATDISTVRKLGKPPYLITLIMDSVCIYFKRHMDPVKPDPDRKFLTPSWNESLKVMNDVRFLFKLQEYHKDSINGEIIDLMVPYLTNELYTFENAKQACGNVAGLVSWTIAMAAFYEVNKEVLPLKDNLAIQQAKLIKAQSELKTAMALLASKEEEVRKCQSLYEEAMTHKQEVYDDAMKIKNKMDAATALIDGLAGERIRWTDQIEQFKSETERLIGDVVLLVGFLNYSGPFNQEFRSMLQKSWIRGLIKKNIPVSSKLKLIDSLTDTATIGEWNLQGLPTDELSTQNGIISTKASRYPLLIDPQSQGKAWVKNKEKENNLIVTTLNNKYFRNFLEDAVSFGSPLIIEDVNEELDPVLDNLLEKNHIKLGTSFKVKLGDKEVDIHDNFKLYITTKLANPSYTPEIFARTSIIDFTVTIKGLEDQLLGRVIMTEKKELETERTNLIIDVTINRRKMLELEQNLLYKLTTTTGSLLDDPTVIDVLAVTKNTATEVRVKLETARLTEIKINAAREEFRPVATRGSVLYFLVVSMSLVNMMYQTSLVQFLERFDISIARSEKNPVTNRRINYINDYLTYEIFKYKSRGLYERHKYMFVLLLTLKIDLEKQKIMQEEFQLLIKGGAALDLNACPPKPVKWITDSTWLNLVEISKLRHFQYIVQQVTTNDKVWKYWFDKDAPEEMQFPLSYNSLDTFRKLLMIRSWCPDRTMLQSRKYIASSIGPKFAEPVILNLEIMYNESRALTPMICFLSIGSDPTPYIEQLGKKLEIKVKSISMGQGQEVHARKLITSAMNEGFWALLQNCHLSLDYMHEVLVIFLDLEKGVGQCHPDFRFWITTEEHNDFPISLLQICIKFTNEAPSGVRAGLLRTYTSMSQDMLDYSDSPQYIPLIYAISFLHTVVQERRKFGPLGWNIPYEYNSADWLASCLFVQNHLDDVDPKKGVSWVTLRYMLGEVHYGGRVTDDFDKILLKTFCKVWFLDKLFSDDFEFYRGYKTVKFKNVVEYLAQIETFSSNDPPQVYGLHANADIAYQTNTTNDMLGQMLSIQPKESAVGTGETREMAVSRQAVDMLGKIPANYDPYEVKERLKIMGHLNPLNIFLRQEIDIMQKVISNVRQTLQDLLLAIEGTIIMNEFLQDALNNIYDALVPAVWLRGSWAARTLGFWFSELLDRDTQFKKWIFHGRPSAFWLTGFFNSQGFLTAMKQEVARAHKGWALDQVTMFNEVTRNAREDITSGPNEGVYVYGLFIDGAGWDKRNVKLCESTNKVLYTLLPVVYIYAVYMTNTKSPTLYTCPVYKKAKRTGLNYITALFLPTLKPPEHWTLRGVALLCDVQ